MAISGGFWSGVSLRPGVAVAVVSLAYGLAAWFGIDLTRDDGRIAALWLPNALLVAAILRQEWPKAAPFMAACHLANIIVAIYMGDSFLTAWGLSVCNTVEVAIVYYGVRKFTGALPDLANFRTLSWFSFFGGIVAPLVSATLATGVLALSGSRDLLGNWTSWAAADALGMLIGAPIIIVIIRTLNGDFTTDRGKLLDWLIVLGIGSILTGLVFAQSSYPFLFMASLFVLLAAFRLGMTGAATATLVVAILATIATSMDSGPIHLVNGDMKVKAFVLQIFLLFTFAGALPVAAALATRDGLEHELSVSRDYSRLILDNMQDVVFRTDENGCWTFLNPAWEELTGYTIKESLGWNTTRLLVEEDFESAREIYPTLVTGEVDELTLHQRFSRADGAVRHVEVKVTAIRSGAGKFMGASGSIRDVTEAREAQEALSRSEKRFETLCRLSPAGIFTTDKAGNCTYVNDAWTRISGVEREDAMGSGWANSVHPDDAERVFQERQEARAKLSTYRSEFRFRKPDGSVTHVFVVAAPKFEDNGEVLSYIGVVIDNSDAVAARRELDEERGRFQHLAENATDAIISFNIEGICLYASKALEDISGYRPEEVVGQAVRIPIDDEGMAELQDVYAKLGAGEIERAKVSYRTEHKTKGWRWHESNIRLVRDPDTGEPMETIASVRDITDRKELEDQLRLARDEAQSAAKAKSSFLANMSHEIRTPMNGVTGFADLLLETRLDDQQRHYAELIAESGKSMVALINDILDLSKIEAGQMAMASDPIDLHHTVNGTLRMMAAAATQKGLALDAEFGEGTDTTILGDKLRIRQIVSNLVGNAIKFTHEGAITVRTAIDDGEAGRFLTISVSDTGIGIDADRQAAIFDEFVQADGTTVRKFGGTGLGLSISRQLAILMGGTLSVESELGKGSTFTLRLPFVAAERADDGPAQVEDDRREGVAPAQDTRRILVVEDHEINRLLTTAMIEKAGYRHSVAQDGFEAIAMVADAKASDTQFDLVLMDIQMPGLDGLEATRRIRASGIAADDLPIVALTANAYQSDVEECLEAGMQAHLAKPLRMDELARVLDTWLPKRREEDATDDDDETVSVLRPRYEAFKRDALDQLEACIAALPDPTPDELDALKQIMHKLAGSAAIFGDEQLGTLASDLENAIEAVESAASDRPIDAILHEARSSMVS